jgi:hypothetical protein
VNKFKSSGFEFALMNGSANLTSASRMFAVLPPPDDEPSFTRLPKTIQGFQGSFSNFTLQLSLRFHQLLDWSDEAGISNQQHRQAKAQVFV